ncbi:helix-hairpin-helix domain-containing protein [Clostridium sp. Marseille-P3244]|uniref:helix-hairpin-helix domain-containing protein n=1 Tax=Clostridium sp. Marseille-P3244 TaxID=1871020 RepID=UPI00092FECF5|nr:helix-hairpin-helix domain-containing protein [Clostridium sp. Marseille-P3244]
MCGDKNKIRPESVIATALLMAVFFLVWGCGKQTEKDGLEEIGLSEELREESEGGISDGSTGSGDEGGSAGEAGQTESVYVYVCGEVKSPGVYELKSDARVFQAIQLAGGMTEEAALDAVNQARTVTDGEQIYVPTIAEAEAQGTGVGEGTSITGADGNKKININTAGKEELMTLTGIGEAKALSILTYREEHGAFGSIEELMEIEGIKEGVFNKIKEDITI